MTTPPDWTHPLPSAQHFIAQGEAHMRNYHEVAFDPFDAFLEYLKARECLRIARGHLARAALDYACDECRTRPTLTLRTVALVAGTARNVAKGRKPKLYDGSNSIALTLATARGAAKGRR